MKMCVWSLACQQNIFQLCHSENIWESFTHKMAAKASWHWNYVTVTLCILPYVTSSYDWWHFVFYRLITLIVPLSLQSKNLPFSTSLSHCSLFSSSGLTPWTVIDTSEHTRFYFSVFPHFWFCRIVSFREDTVSIILINRMNSNWFVL